MKEEPKNPEKIRAKSLPSERDFSFHLNGQVLNTEHDSDDSGVCSRSTTYTNLSNQDSRRPSSFDFWPDEIQLEYLSALSKDQSQEEEIESVKTEAKPEGTRPNSSVGQYNKTAQKPCMDYLTVKPAF